MPSAIPIRLHPSAKHREISTPPRKLKHAPSTSYNQIFLSQSPPVNLTSRIGPEERPAKRQMPSLPLTIAVVNSSGRQAASFIRVASAVGYKVRAQLRNLDGIVASEISELENVQVLVGELYNKKPVLDKPSADRASPGTTSSIQGADFGGINQALIDDLFKGANAAFINTTFWGDEVAIGKALADAAVKAKVTHYIYSTMPDHSRYDPSWPSLPLWSAKQEVEDYILSLPSLAPVSSFLLTGIYNNNFSSLPYPLFCTELQEDESFLWQAPFHPDVKLPWLDAEHDVGPAVLQIVKDGAQKWGGHRVPLAYEMLSPREACESFTRGVGRPVRYERLSKIEIRVKVPIGYTDQLRALEKMYSLSATDPSKQPFYFGDANLEKSCTEQSFALWEGYRGLEEYAREAFPLEEYANGKRWMQDEDDEASEGRIEGGDGAEADDDDDDGSEGLTMGSGISGAKTPERNKEMVSPSDGTPARKEESWLA